MLYHVSYSPGGSSVNLRIHVSQSGSVIYKGRGAHPCAAPHLGVAGRCGGTVVGPSGCEGGGQGVVVAGALKVAGVLR